MKKLIAMLLLVVMVLSLAACGKEKEKESSGDSLDGIFTVGYSRVNITPTYSVPLAGYGNTSERMSTGFLSYLLSTCIVFTDEDGTSVMVFQNDLSGCPKAVMDPIKEKISLKIGIPKENIMIAGTHTHSGPDMGNTAIKTIIEYRADIEKWMLQAAEEAWNDRTEVTKMTTGRIQLPVNTLNFIRHYTT